MACPMAKKKGNKVVMVRESMMGGVEQYARCEEEEEGTINRTSCRVVEGGFGAEIGPTIDGHRARELGLVVG